MKITNVEVIELRTPGWTPTLPAATPGRFELADLLRFAKVLPAATP